MSLLDLLQHYVGNDAPTDHTIDHFEQVARSAPQADLADGIASAFRSERTPPFGQMISQMFGRADPNQRAGILNQLIASLGPGALAAIASGPLGQILQRGSVGGPPVITPEDAAKITPDQVQQAADHAEAQHPAVVDSMGDFFARHSGLVKTLGSAALAIALAKIANRRR